MRASTFALALLLSTTVACGKSAPASGGGESAPPPSTSSTASAAAPAATAPTADAAGKAKEIFAQRCTPCHGAGGAGDGPASASLDPKPRNFTDAAWQASVDDAYLEKIIKYGGAAVGKSAAMPGNPDLNDPAVLTALKDVLRSLAK